MTGHAIAREAIPPARVFSEALPRSGSRSFGRHVGELMFNGRSSRGLYPPLIDLCAPPKWKAKPTHGTNHL
jgi:hypothetical protein